MSEQRTVSSAEPLKTWCARWGTVGVRFGQGPEIADLVATGVAHADLVAYSAALWPGEPVDRRATKGLVNVLMVLHEHYRDLTLRSGIGWGLVRIARNNESGKQFSDLMPPWVDAGLVEVGWLFDAAGMSVAEASLVLERGGDGAWDGVLALAALGPVSLPA